MNQDNILFLKVENKKFKVNKDIISYKFGKIKELIDEQGPVKDLKIPLTFKQLHLIMLFINYLELPKTKEEVIDLWIASNYLKLHPKFKKILYSETLDFLRVNNIDHYPIMSYEAIFEKLKRIEN